MLRDKTRLLCTHQIQYAKQADYLILMDDGEILRAGSMILFSDEKCQSSRFSLGKPDEVLDSDEFLRLMSNFSSQTTGVNSTSKSTNDVEEQQLIQTENALQTDAEERCTGSTMFFSQRY